MHSVSYELTPDGHGNGTAVLTIEDINSDALDATELNEDKKNLFDFMYKSDDFIEQMKDEGKKINSRELFVADGKLNGIVKFSFDDIELVEGIIYEEPFYFLTLAVEDSPTDVPADFGYALLNSSFRILPSPAAQTQHGP